MKNIQDHINRHWKLKDLGNGWFKIVCKNGSCLDSWGGIVGENSASMSLDDGTNYDED